MKPTAVIIADDDAVRICEIALAYLDSKPLDDLVCRSQSGCVDETHRPMVELHATFDRITSRPWNVGDNGLGFAK